MENIKRRKISSYCIVGAFFLMGGIEYAVVLPTIWLYIHTRYKSDEYMLGILLSAYSFAAMVAGPLLGRIADRTRKPRLIMVLCTLFVIVGNLMYSIGLSEWFILISRLVVGIGDGCESVIIGEIARVTAEEERTGILSILISIRQMGLLIGPAFTVFLRLANFYIGPVLIDKYSVPGFCFQIGTTFFVKWNYIFARIYFSLLHNNDGTTYPYIRHDPKAFMACLWTVELLLFIFLYTDLHKINRAILREEQRLNSLIDSMQRKRLSSVSSSNYNSYDSMKKDDLMSTVNETDYRYMEIRKKTQHGTIKKEVGNEASTASDSRAVKLDNKTLEESVASGEGGEIRRAPKITCRFLYKEYIREEIVVILGIQFNCYFNQIGLETMVTPLSTKYLGFGELQNSLMYCFAAIEMIAVFVLVRYLSKKLADRTLILIGVSVLIGAQCWLLYAIPSLDTDTKIDNLLKFAVGILLDMFALPFLSVCTASLFSKITSRNVQGMSQGLGRSVIGMATIMGPLWTGSTLIYPYIMLGVMLGLLLMSFVMLVLSYSRLKTNGSEVLEVEYKRRHAESISEEREALLS